MKKYIEMLEEMGVASSRCMDLANAINDLVGAISKLDNSGLKAFSQLGLLGHIDQFAELTASRNVAQELYTIKLEKAYNSIDFGEFYAFPEFSDKLYNLTESIAEVHVPGASMLCKALCDLRQKYENDPRIMPMDTLQTRVAKKLEALLRTSAINGRNLEIRESHKYVGTCQNLDDWRPIGSVVTILRRTGKEKSFDGSRTDYLYVQVTSDQYETDIRQALQDMHTSIGCACEHDCCGCASQRVGRIKELDRNVWVIRLHISYNY